MDYIIGNNHIVKIERRGVVKPTRIICVIKNSHG